jgi:LuxR family transcriptional regulator, maltose regulon positive regulatory protein
MRGLATQLIDRQPPISVSSARLSPPRPVAGTLDRGRLFERLDSGVRGPVTVITGPPGAGKTQLLSSWLGAREPLETAAWLIVDRAETRPAEFWGAVIEAVAAAGGTGVGPLASGAALSEARFLAEFANAITALERPLTLILDDFHELRAPRVSEQLDRLLRRPPERLALVIASRSDPRLSLQRLRLEGHVTEIRAADLAFTAEEAQAMFAAAGLRLTATQVGALQSRTEGWAAGLRLAALSLGSGQDADELIATFSGDERSVADYLVEGVRQHQPEEIRDFMLKTSVVDLLTPELADALTGHSDGAPILELLERSNAFVSPVGPNGAWYRYHGMFGALLRTQLRHHSPDGFAAAHRRAARWYVRASLNVEATRHALAAGDWELAGDVLAAGWLELLVRGEAREAADLLESLPPRAAARRPELAIAAAGALIEAGELPGGEQYLRIADDAASALKPARRSDFVLGRTIARMLQARSQGRFADIRPLARKLMAGQGSASGTLAGRERRAIALIHLGIADAWAGRRRHARASLEEALSLAGHGGRPYLGFSALGQLALLEAANGALRRSTRFAHEAVELAERNGWMRRSASAAAHCALAMCAYHHNSMGQSGQYLDLAEEAARASRERPVAVVAAVIRTRIALLRGDPDAAEVALREAYDEAGDWEIPLRLAGAVSAAEAETLVAASRAADAVQWLDGEPGLGRWGEGQVIRAKLALAQGDPRRASELIADGVDRPASIMHASSAIELRALGAVAMHQRGDDESALELVELALAAAEPEGFVSPFLSVGAPLRDLLARRIRAGTAHRALAGELGEAMAPRSDPDVEQRSALVLEPLSDREAVVLRYLPTGLSKAEIAAEMFVSVNTVKTHMKNIYRKLDVTDRGQAVRRARTLHLV